MRQELERILGEEIRYLAIETRDNFDLTQREMGEKHGIAVCANTDMNETTSVLALIQDITTDRDSLDELVNLCNSMELSPLHIGDVIEDFLVR